MGAALAMPVVAVGRPAARRWLRERGFRIVAADPAGGRSYRDVDYRGPLAIVVGSERRGLAREWRAAADSVAAIPMLGISDSVNAAVAGALLLYEALAHDAPLAGQDLQTFEINAAAFVDFEVAARKIVADDSDKVYWAEETGGQGGVAGGAAEQARILALGGLDGIQRGRANNQNTHAINGKFKLMEAGE